ncbi:MAG: tRNA epoxyqueuosine(34) reductase QueG [Alphaproteobacteria bacterium]|nr:tRNA epoxyqueuosine(34) reductase QueG [Alphaproteobacteria bacterium]
MTAAVREAIRSQALASGFDAVGFAAATLADKARGDLAEFLARGYHGDMGWLAAHAARRGDPRALWPDARSVVVLGANYGPAAEPAVDIDDGAVSVYARGRDYHETIKKRLKSLGRWIAERWPSELKVFVDTAPVMEKPLAQQAGIGWQGKHTNLVSRAFGSWLFLGEIYLSLELEPDAPEQDHCGTCRACLDACPTNAFPAPHRLDARRCISYLTIEHKGMIDADLRPLLGNRIYGCDDCLAVCPWNKYAKATEEPDFLPRQELSAPRLAKLAGLDEASFRAMFAGNAVRRIGRDRFLRNVLIAIGNSGDPQLAAALLPRLDDTSALVRASAVWAYARLDPHAAARAAKDRLAVEAEPLVRDEWLVLSRAGRGGIHAESSA